MKQKLITEIRSILDFMEEFDTLVSQAKTRATKNGKTIFTQHLAVLNPV